MCFIFCLFCNPIVLLEYLTMMCRKSAIGNHRCADKMPLSSCEFFFVSLHVKTTASKFSSAYYYLYYINAFYSFVA